MDGASFIGSFQSDLSCSSGFPHSFGKQLYNARGNSAGGSNALSRTPSAAVSISHSCSTNDNSIHEMSPRIRSRTRSRSKNESKNRRETVSVNDSTHMLWVMNEKFVCTVRFLHRELNSDSKSRLTCTIFFHDY